MEFLNRLLGTNGTLLGLPPGILLAVFLLLLITIVCRGLFSRVIINSLGKLAARTQTDIDDVLLDAAHKPLSWIIMLTGMHAIRLLLLPYLHPDIASGSLSILQFLLVALLCWLLFRSAEALTALLEKVSRRTKTELDDLLLPYVSRALKLLAVLIISIKAAEIFLGMSAASLIGLLGGMGLTLGLVFRDIIANWFGCAIIYIDNLFRIGDWVQLDDGRLIDADVEQIGIRSTIFRNFDKTVSIVPNGTIASAVVKNWSRMYKRRVKYEFRIDGINAGQLERVLEKIRGVLNGDNDIHQEFHMVNFRSLEGNARCIRLYYFTKTTVWKTHEQVRENINLKILQIFEDEQLDTLSYTVVDLSDDRPHSYTPDSR